MGIFKALYGDHNREEWIRTVDSVISVVLQLVSIAVQAFGVWWMVKHYH